MTVPTPAPTPATPHRHRVPPRVHHDPRLLSERMHQPPLIDAEDKWYLAFLTYHTAHPEVYAAFRDIALRLYNRGIRHWGAKAIMEVLRFETAIRAHGEPFKLDNSYTSYYARMLMQNDPTRFKGFFDVRKHQPRKGKRV
jgi:hypothetical protein